MPSFKVNNWDLDVNKEKSTVSIKAHNPSNNSDFAKELTNEDIAAEGFMLIDDIDDLYASLTEGSKSCQEAIKLSITDDGHLTISQKVTQADREKVFKSDITLDKIEKKEAEKKQPETKEPKTTHLKKEKKSAQEHKFFFDKIAELENEIKGLKTGYGNDLAEIKKMLGEQADSIKSLQEENANLKKTLDDAEKNKPETQGSGLTFISHPNFNLSNNGKTAISNTNTNHAIYLSPSISKGITYSFKIIGDSIIMLGLIPENDSKTDNPSSEPNACGLGGDGGVFPNGVNTNNATFKGGDTVTIQLTNENKVVFTAKNQATYTRELSCSISNYQIFLFTNCAVGIGMEVL